MESLTKKTQESNQSRKLQLEDFHMDIPQDSIAFLPSQKRENSKLLYYNKAQEISHHQFHQLPELIPNSILIFNDTKVFSCRVYGTTPTGAKVEIFLLEKPTGVKAQAHALCKPLKKIKLNQPIAISPEINATLIKNEDGNLFQFSCDEQTLSQFLKKNGDTPLPPYIKRSLKDPSDKQRYQTVYANDEWEGSVAAPTAGLHFSKELISDMKTKYNIAFAPVTLHVGAGTFLPIKNQDPTQHQMHSEKYQISQETIQLLKGAIKDKRPIIAVGSTSFRALEAYFQQSEGFSKDLSNQWLSTNLYIHAESRLKSYHPQFINAILTNFHQPDSTLFQLISALIGLDEVKRIYQTALQKDYKFFSYGDSNLYWLR